MITLLKKAGRHLLYRISKVHEATNDNDFYLNTFERSSVFEATTTKFLPKARIFNTGKRDNLLIGQHCIIAGELSITTYEGKLSLGHHCFLGEGSRIWVYENIEIGNHVLISHLVDIHDSDGHPLNWLERRDQTRAVLEGTGNTDYGGLITKPICIQDDVWIGFKSTILKGVTIGRGAVVAAGSVVTKDVPPFTLVAGNPASVVRALPE